MRSGLRKLPNVHCVLGEVKGIDFSARLVQITAFATPYAYLIMALGSTPHFFGVPGAAEHALPLRTLAHAIAARNQILRRFERAVHEPDAQRRHALLTNLHGRTFTGFIAWQLWLSVHIFNLIGFRNRLLVLVNWAWDYFFYERAVRLILPSDTAPGA